MSSAEVEVSSLLDADPGSVWDWATTPEGINDEMRPFLRMTVPRGVEQLDLSELPLGRRVGRSWILLFGVLPFDYDDVTLVRLDPGESFLERSKMLTQRVWEHERTLRPAGSGCRIADRVRWEPRLGLPAGPLRAPIGAFFAHRHRRLRRRFGGSAGA